MERDSLTKLNFIFMDHIPISSSKFAEKEANGPYAQFCPKLTCILHKLLDTLIELHGFIPEY